MKKLQLFFSACFLLFSYGLKGQNVIHIPNDVSTISGAVQLAQNGDTIYISQGIYSESVHILNKDLKFQGVSDGGSVLSPGLNERSFVIEYSSVEFIDLKFDDFDLQSQPPNIGISASYSDIIIQNCEFHSIFTPVSLLWSEFKMNNSMISNTRNGRCILQNGGSFIVYNNLFYDLTSTAISINRAHGEFFNNTIVGSTPNQFRGMIINSDSTSYIYNNIISGFGIGVQLIASNVTELNALQIYNNNIHDMAAPYWYEYNEDLSLPIQSGALIPNPGTGEISVSPDFVDPFAKNFTLQSNSACIDTGIDTYNFPISQDLAGNQRIFGNHPDIGAYEYNSNLSISEFDAFQYQINLYPNPTTDEVWVEFKNDFSGDIKLFDLTGKLLQTLRVLNVSNITLTLPFEAGIYLVKISSTNGSIATKKLIKE